MPKKPYFVVVGPDVAISAKTWLAAVENNKTILLRESTFYLWNHKNIDLGFQVNTNSEFAEFLLHSLVQRKQFEQESVRRA